MIIIASKTRIYAPIIIFLFFFIFFLEVVIKNIPTKIKENFQCDEYDSCTLLKEKNTLVYSMGFFYINNDVENYTYDLRSENLSYSNFQKNISFEITNNNVNCMSGNCEEAKKIYENFRYPQ